ncbi:SHOCT-like domain-containing protein [Glycomyces sambucus]|uniref:SHOCT-like domain-containing protein n=1 Tax=Glycomyces sambucus TaxID=380244 RepID=UPI000B836978|nr:STAS/SEC14 domain-containing protein [Glycomyces sambucus]
MNEQRRQILQMLADGKITADEAERLLTAVETVEEPDPAAPTRGKGRPKYLRLIVDANDEHSGETKVNIRVPLKLLRAGMRLAVFVPPQALERANQELVKQGVPIDLTEIKPNQLEDLVDALDDLTLDVDQTDTKVRIFCE